MQYGTDDGKRARKIVGAVGGRLAAGLLLWLCGSAGAAPEISWVKPYTRRVWTYADGTKLTAAYDSYRGGEVYLITEGSAKSSIAMQRLSAEDQNWVLSELKKPHGLLNDVVFGKWQDQRPLFWINASFFTKGNVTESPVACVQYIFLDRQQRVIKRICDPLILYPNAGKQNLEQQGTLVRKQCLGPREQDVTGAKMLASRAVMLLLSDNQKEWLVLDVLSNQNNDRLRAAGVPPDWWDQRYSVGAWPMPGIGGAR